jgi:hypothetical protein
MKRRLIIEGKIEGGHYIMAIGLFASLSCLALGALALVKARGAKNEA